MIKKIEKKIGGGELSSIESALLDDIRLVLASARNRAYSAVNFAMVDAYWNVGRLIVEKQGGEERSSYGDSLLEGLSKDLSQEFGKGFDERNLRNMRQFYLTFPIRNALRTELTWSHYRLIMRVENPRAREYYLSECAEGNWSTRQLERQINSFCYERVLSSRDKESVKNEIIQKESAKAPEDIVKDPCILEFLGSKTQPKPA